MTPLSADAVFSCYEYLLDHSRYVDWNEHFRQWGWEFLRRREEYRADWTNGNHTVAKAWGLAALADPGSENPPEFKFPQHWDRIVLTSDLEIVYGAESAQNYADARSPQYRPDSWRNFFFPVT